MQYNPKDLKEPPQIKEGRYSFKVANANETTSKNSGNPMIKVELSVNVGYMKAITINDYLVGIASCLFKVKQFCDCVGIDFNNGNLEIDDVLGAMGEAIFVNETGDNGKKYLKVAKYVSANEPPAEDGSEQEQGQSQVPSRGDDIPF